MSVYAVLDAADDSPAVPPLDLVAIEADVQAPSVELAVDEPYGAQAPGAATDCDLTATVQEVLRSSAGVRAALSSLPPADRSVANAVMLWDGRWIDGTSTQSRAALAQVRAAVATVVRDASAACREQTQAGPRLIAIAGTPDIVLALGSGRWRWGDLASP